VSISLIEQFIVSLGLVYTGFIFLHIILGYLQLSYSPWLGRLRALTYDTVEPYLRWWRNIIPSAGGMDFSHRRHQHRRGDRADHPQLLLVKEPPGGRRTPPPWQSHP
jgi:uncharacterized protein YggT (Ycf19 family)